mmetsp:Transcript_2042/g.7972  ORF Transcript_2042/g.7972 Transcript_2042/m.7972 type:complete len:277 (+) Transcript_2042:597-1427(+)
MPVHAASSHTLCMANACGVPAAPTGMVIIRSSPLTTSPVCESRTSNAYVMRNVAGRRFVVFSTSRRESLAPKLIGAFTASSGIKSHRFSLTRITSRSSPCDRRRARTAFVTSRLASSNGCPSSTACTITNIRASSLSGSPSGYRRARNAFAAARASSAERRSEVAASSAYARPIIARSFSSTTTASADDSLTSTDDSIASKRSITARNRTSSSSFSERSVSTSLVDVVNASSNVSARLRIAASSPFTCCSMSSMSSFILASAAFARRRSFSINVRF